MSLKEIFSHSVLKPMILEFLRSRADFKVVPNRLKKPFKGQALKIQDQKFGNANGYNGAGLNSF